MKVRGRRSRYLPSRFARQRARYNRKGQEKRPTASPQSPAQLPPLVPSSVSVPTLSTELNVKALLPAEFWGLLESGPVHQPSVWNEYFPETLGLWKWEEEVEEVD